VLALGRVIISAGREREDSKVETGHAELYQDGSGFAATRLWIPRQDRESRGVEIDDERLPCQRSQRFQFLSIMQSVAAAVWETRLSKPP